jgi:RHS repeat-associated protein
MGRMDKGAAGSAVEACNTDSYGNTLIFTGPGPDNTWFTDDDGQSSYGASGIIYCGYRYDAETENYYVRNRYYSPTLGRWLTRDPIDYAGGMNLQEYVEAMVATSTDPSGLEQVMSGGQMSELATSVLSRLQTYGSPGVGGSLARKAALFCYGIATDAKSAKLTLGLGEALARLPYTVLKQVVPEGMLLRLARKFGRTVAKHLLHSVESALKHDRLGLWARKYIVRGPRFGAAGNCSYWCQIVIIYNPNTERFRGFIRGLVPNAVNANGFPDSTNNQGPPHPFDFPFQGAVRFSHGWFLTHYGGIEKGTWRYNNGNPQ